MKAGTLLYLAVGASQWLAAGWHLGADLHVALVQGLIFDGSHTGHQCPSCIGLGPSMHRADKLLGRVSLYMAQRCVCTPATPAGTHVASTAWMLMQVNFTKMNEGHHMIA